MSDKPLVPLIEDAVKGYLDECIIHWRMCDAPPGMAKYYVDAFQSVRSSLFGETLPEEPRAASNPETDEVAGDEDGYAEFERAILGCVSIAGIAVETGLKQTTRLIFDLLEREEVSEILERIRRN